MFDGKGFSGGPTINLTRLLPVLFSRGYRIDLLCFYINSHPNASLLEAKGIKCHYKKQSLMSYRIVPWILKKIEEINPDIFIPDISTQGLIAGKWLTKNGIKVINSLRGNDDLNWGKAIFFSRRGKWQSSAIVCVNEFLENKLKTKLNLEIPSIVIPSGVLKSNHISNQLTKNIKIVYSGRFVNNPKNVDKILDLFLKLAKENLEIEFSLIGSGNEKYNLQQKIDESGYNKRIKIYKPLKNGEYKEFLAQHQIIVLLSDHEGTPGAIMDGMSCGLVPVVSNTEGIEKLVINNENGFVVDNKTNAPFKKIIELLRNNDLRIEFSNTAIDHISQRYDIDICANQWERLLGDLQVKRHHRFKRPIFYKLPKKSNLLKEHLTASNINIFKYRLKQILGWE
jgi:glycosyltransferase involved in cell wall biosynthesis